MEIQFVIVRSENAEYLCHNVNGTYVDVSDPSTEFVSGEDDFRLVEPDSSLTRKEYEFRGERFYLMPQFYGNGWLALTLQSVEDETEYIVLSVNLESMDALDLPDRTFIDVNHYPDAGHKRRSGFVEYPMAVLNLPLLYQHAPQIFQEANIECF